LKKQFVLRASLLRTSGKTHGGNMTTKLPARPNLEHLRTQAKTLLSQWIAGDASALATFLEYLPSAKKLTPKQAAGSRFRLADAQSVIARKNGFSSWPALVRHVEQLRQLEGTWEYVDLEVDGNRMPDAALASSRILIDGDRFRVESPEAIYEGIFAIDVEQAPHHIDIDFVEGPEAGNSSYGIFEVTQDNFKICLGVTGASRPRSFSTSAGSGHALENLRRTLKTRPAGVKGGTPQARSSVALRVDDSAFRVKPTALLKKLEGEWTPVQLVQNGQRLPDAMLAFGSRTVVGNEMKVVFGGQVMVHVRMRIDESQSPVALDYLNIGRSMTGRISLGIMEWIGDEIRICMSAPGEPRPTEFSCEPGSNRTLSQWKRK
jgi:uncharacterized protein (TIGR03067 family)